MQQSSEFQLGPKTQKPPNPALEWLDFGEKSGKLAEGYFVYECQ
jgi:hypothetical protein